MTAVSRTERIPLRFFVALLGLLALPSAGLGGPFHWGIEAGVNRSALDLRSTTAPQSVDSRMLPAVAVTAVQPLSSRWALHPGVRYVQQGERSSYAYPGLTYRSESVLEHTVSGGMGIEFRPFRSVFLSAGPELTYLLAGKLSGTALFQSSGAIPISYHDDYAPRSDRWNATVRAGVGYRWSIGGGAGVLQARYVRGINDMTRITPAVLSPNQRNVAWYSGPVPYDASEWRTEGVELVAGFEW